MITRPSAYFWLDTLCVPPDSLNRHSLQELAISQMRDTYEKAAVVLTIESWLGQCPARHLGALEKVMRVLVSPWNRRLWTLQEAILCSFGRFYVWFQDGPCAIDAEYHALRESMNKGKRSSLLLLLVRQYYTFRAVFQGTEAGVPKGWDRFSAIIQNVYCRQTGVATDEPLCLATLLGANIAPIVAIESNGLGAEAMAEKRMLALWEQTREIPGNVLFLSAARLAVDGFRWAPLILLQTDQLAGVNRGRSFAPALKCFREQRGLRSALWGITFNPGHHMLDLPTFYVYVAATDTFWQISPTWSVSRTVSTKHILLLLCP